LLCLRPGGGTTGEGNKLTRLIGGNAVLHGVEQPRGVVSGTEGSGESTGGEFEKRYMSLIPSEEASGPKDREVYLKKTKYL